MEKRPNDTIEMLRAEFANVRKTAIVGHLHPDGDCISSCLALYHYLKDNYGYEADVYLEPYPSVFDMLPDTAVIRHTVKPEVYDVVYSLDCADLDRIGAGKELFDSAKKRVMIDHHISNPVFGDVNYVKGEIGSACEVLYTLFEEDKINYNVAMCLYTGMVHDTGVFQYSNVTPDTLTRAAKLIAFGIPFTDLIQKTFYEKSFNETRASAVVYSLDCADLDRIGAGKELFDSAKKRVMIDHHISNPVFGDVNYVKGEIGSACEVLYTLFEEDKINYNVAMCLYTGMVHDTGVFQYSNVTPDTLTRAAKLIAFGIPFTDLIQKTFYEKSFNETRASAYAISKAAQLLDGFFVWSYMETKEMERFHITSAELDSVVSELRNIRGVDTAVFLYEIESGVWKCSFRSNHVVNVSELAVSFGGGGHVRASGCTFYHKKPDEIITEIVNRIPKEDYAGRAL